MLKYMCRKAMILHPLFVKVKTSVVFTEEIVKLKEMTGWNK